VRLLKRGTCREREPRTHHDISLDEQCVTHLKDEFGKGLVCDVDANDIAKYRSKRLAAGVSNRTANYETGALRGILRQYGLWGPIADKVKALPERHDVGRAIPFVDESKLLAAASASRSPALLPLVVLSLDTGMRLGETQALCRRDVRLEWASGSILRGEIVVPKSKTAAGTGRVIPLSRRVCACLTLWLDRFPEAGPDSFLFPYHKVGTPIPPHAVASNPRAAVLCDVDLNRPMGSWRKAWRLACKAAGVRYRPHDMRPLSFQGWRRIRASASRRLKLSRGTLADRCSNATATSGLRQSRSRFRRSNNRQSSQFCRRQGTKSGTVGRAVTARQKLTHWKQMVGPQGFEPWTDGL